MRILYDGYVYREPFAGESTVLSNLIKRAPSHFVPVLTTGQDHIFDYPAHTNLQGFTFKQVRPLRISSRVEVLLSPCGISRPYFLYVGARALRGVVDRSPIQHEVNGMIANNAEEFVEHVLDSGKIRSSVLN
jgi:hypothetical protein